MLPLRNETLHFDTGFVCMRLFLGRWRDIPFVGHSRTSLRLVEGRGLFRSRPWLRVRTERTKDDADRQRLAQRSCHGDTSRRDLCLDFYIELRSFPRSASHNDPDRRPRWKWHVFHPRDCIKIQTEEVSFLGRIVTWSIAQQRSPMDGKAQRDSPVIRPRTQPELRSPWRMTGCIHTTGRVECRGNYRWSCEL